MHAETDNSLPHPGNIPRIISLSPNITELVAAAGGLSNLIARSSACNWPPEVQKLPAAGNFGQPFSETILSLNPTLVLLSTDSHPGAERVLKNINIPFRRIQTQTLADIPQALREIGTILNTSKLAATKATELENGISRLREANKLAKTAPNVLILVSVTPPITAGKGSFISEMLELAGAYNIAAVREQPYYPVSLEWAVQANPDIVLFLLEQAVALPVVLQKIPAIKAGRYSQSDQLTTDIICRPGPRILEGAAALRQLLENASSQTTSPE